MNLQIAQSYPCLQINSHELNPHLEYFYLKLWVKDFIMIKEQRNYQKSPGPCIHLSKLLKSIVLLHFFREEN